MGSHKQKQKIAIPQENMRMEVWTISCQENSVGLNKSCKTLWDLNMTLLNPLCLHRSIASMAGSTRSNAKAPDSNTPAGEITMTETSPTNKRNAPEASKSAQKRAKSHHVSLAIQRDLTLLEFWDRFPIMESHAYDASLPPLTARASVAELISLGHNASEAEELHTAKTSFPRVIQKLWPTSRPDNIPGQHVNITQLPSDIEVHPMTKLSLDYQVLLHFEKPNDPFTQDHIMKKVL